MSDSSDEVRSRIVTATVNSSESEDLSENEEDRKFINDESEGTDDTEVETGGSSEASEVAKSDLDEDDIELIEENRGIQRKRKKNFKRLKRKEAPKKKSSRQKDLEALFEEDEQTKEADDDIDNFVVYDDERDDLPTRKQVARRAIRVEGISQDAWKEMFEIFGDGSDYAFAFDDFDNADAAVDRPQFVSIEQAYEPTILAEKMYLPEDEAIRITDVPERIQLRDTAHREIAQNELEQEADWICPLLLSSGNIKPDSDRQRVKQTILDVLKFMREDYFEVPFIASHRREYFEDCLGMEDLWSIYDYDEKWKSLKSRLDNLRLSFDKLCVATPRLHDGDGYFLTMLLQATCDEDINDLHDYLNLYFEEDLFLMKQEASSTTKKSFRRSDYYFATKAGLSSLLEKISIKAKQFGENLSHGYKKWEPNDSPERPEELASRYISSSFSTINTIVNATLVLLATELAHDPLVRKFVRGFLIAEATISTAPTDKGRKEITSNHEFSHIKYINEKPITKFNNGEYIEYMKATESGDLEVHVSFRNKDAFFQKMCSLFFSDGLSASAEHWNNFRRKALNIALEDSLYPLIQKEVKYKLANEAIRWVAGSCQYLLQDRLVVSRFKAANQEGEEDDSCKIMAISWGDGSFETATICVVVNENGDYLDHIKLHHMQDRNKRDSDAGIIRRFLALHQPRAIAVAGKSVSTRNLFTEVQKIALESKEFNEVEYPISVTFVEDDIARIFETSNRAAQEFPKHSSLLKYCIALARRLQEPLLEHAALCNPKKEISCLALHPYQKMIPQDLLLKFLERAFINVVNLVGVDINYAQRHPTAKYLLQFVGGLGPRKAHAFLRQVASIVDVFN